MCIINQTTTSINREEYEKQLAETQRRHLEQIKARKERNWRPCMHDQCNQCHGTGVKWDGSLCIHLISCPCPKCSPSYL